MFCRNLEIGSGAEREIEIQNSFSVHTKSSYQGRIVCLSMCKWFYACLIIRLILSHLHFQQEDVQLWLSHVAFCKQWVSFQNANLIWDAGLVFNRVSGTRITRRGTATCCNNEIILIVVLELPGLFTDVCKCRIWLRMNYREIWCLQVAKVQLLALNLEYHLVLENHNIGYTFSGMSGSPVCELWFRSKHFLQWLCWKV